MYVQRGSSAASWLTAGLCLTGIYQDRGPPTTHTITHEGLDILIITFMKKSGEKYPSCIIINQI